MKLHEYQSKQIFSKYGIPIPKGRVASTAEEAKQIALEALIATGVLDENGNAKEQIVTSSQYIRKEEKAPTKTLGPKPRNNK